MKRYFKNTNFHCTLSIYVKVLPYYKTLNFPFITWSACCSSNALIVVFMALNFVFTTTLQNRRYWDILTAPWWTSQMRRHLNPYFLYHRSTLTTRQHRYPCCIMPEFLWVLNPSSPQTVHPALNYQCFLEIMQTNPLLSCILCVCDEPENVGRVVLTTVLCLF